MSRGREPYPEAAMPSFTPDPGLGMAVLPYLLVECRLAPGEIAQRVIGQYSTPEAAEQQQAYLQGQGYYCLAFYVARNSSGLWERLNNRKGYR